jgi:hypothetical protein
MLRMNFDGPAGMAVDWSAESDGLTGLVHRVNANLLTMQGSDRLLPDRGNTAAKEILGYGAFDAMNIQHSLNFAASKIKKDMSDYAGDQLQELGDLNIRLVGIQDGGVYTSLVVTHINGEKTKETTALS